MKKARTATRVGAAAFALGLSLAGPQGVCVASADSPDTDSASVSGATVSGATAFSGFCCFVCPPGRPERGTGSGSRAARRGPGGKSRCRGR